MVAATGQLVLGSVLGGAVVCKPPRCLTLAKSRRRQAQRIACAYDSSSRQVDTSTSDGRAIDAAAPPSSSGSHAAEIRAKTIKLREEIKARVFSRRSRAADEASSLGQTPSSGGVSQRTQNDYTPIKRTSASLHPQPSVATPRYQQPSSSSAGPQSGAFSRAAAPLAAADTRKPEAEQAVFQRRTAGEVQTSRGSSVSGVQKPLSRVRFCLKYHAEFGQRLRVVGSHEDLGAWNVRNAPELSWAKGDLWNTTVELPAGGLVEYKFVLLSEAGAPLAWQKGNNSVLAISFEEFEVYVFDNWEGEPGAAVKAGGETMTRESKLLSWAHEMEAQVAVQRSEVRRSRMEMASMQEEMRAVKLELRETKARLALSETGRLKDQQMWRELEGMNRMLRSQLAETTVAFQTALKSIRGFLRNAEESVRGSQDDDGYDTDGDDDSAATVSAPTAASGNDTNGAGDSHESSNSNGSSNGGSNSGGSTGWTPYDAFVSVPEPEAVQVGHAASGAAAAKLNGAAAPAL